MIAGVCGGIATYLGVDSVFVRLAFVVLAIASGVGFLLYLILWIVMPSEENLGQPSSKIVQDNFEQFGNDMTSGFKQVRRHPQGPVVAAGLLILIGFYLLFNNFGWLGWLSGGVFWSLVLIGLGIYLLTRRGRQQ
jgi:phage shock protein PspC (stress-responsive transcriptional regulator)